MGREVGNGAPVLGREPWTVRVAVWSARHRWVVLGAWFVFTLGLMFASVAAGGQRSQSVMDKGKTIGDSQTGWNVFNDASTAQKIDTETFYLIVSNPNGKLDTPANRQAVADMTKRLTALTAKVDGRPTPVFYQVRRARFRRLSIRSSWPQPLRPRPPTSSRPTVRPPSS